MGKNSFSVLFVGDVVGRSGRKVVRNLLPKVISLYDIDFVVANVENASAGKGLDKKGYLELLDCGIDVMTLGNHTFQKAEIKEILEHNKNIIRPANYPDGTLGRGYIILEKKGIRVAVINLLGRLFMSLVDCPFRKFDSIYSMVKDEVDLVFVDFHAEATSEKQAFGWYVMGRADVVVGTHTHVQTADERLLGNKTAYITDIGMCGAIDSVIGFRIDKAIRRFLVADKIYDEVAKDNLHLQGLFVKFVFDTENRYFISHIHRINEVY